MLDCCCLPVTESHSLYLHPCLHWRRSDWLSPPASPCVRPSLPPLLPAQLLLPAPPTLSLPSLYPGGCQWAGPSPRASSPCPWPSPPLARAPTPLAPHHIVDQHSDVLWWLHSLQAAVCSAGGGGQGGGGVQWRRAESQYPASPTVCSLLDWPENSCSGAARRSCGPGRVVVRLDSLVAALGGAAAWTVYRCLQRRAAQRCSLQQTALRGTVSSCQSIELQCTGLHSAALHCGE